FKKELTFKYNANNELSQTILTHHKGSDTVVTTTHYYYDAFGRRIHKHSQISQGSNTEQKHMHMLWDGDNAIQEHTDTHVYNTIYDQGSFTPVARMVWRKDTLQQAANDDSDNVVSNQDSSSIQVYHYHNDQLGTPNELTNSQGEVVWFADYEAWGNTAKVVWREEKLEQLKVSADELQPIRFQGQYCDEETGLHYNRFRYYDPDMGMFTTSDPIGLMGGDNVFAYAPNPVNWVDPLGLRGGGVNSTNAYTLKPTSPVTNINSTPGFDCSGIIKSDHA
ncbi:MULTISPECIES: RHS repeat-associated core domain-containing protein, partial [unclassified Psychrobacter]|uniref:RHS repeat-associated core domain-containing protein n=1 Tax=unclassified Psychrobacter TaxID=196806 RepID=UPI00403788A8